MLWSNNKGFTYNYLLTPEHEKVALLKMSGMAIKSLYLNGFCIEKSIYRNMFIRAEDLISYNTSISDISFWSKELMVNFDIKNWLETKNQNYKYAKKLMIDIDYFKIIDSVNKDIFPFSFLVFFESHKKRESVKKKLIDNNIFPHILWPLDNSIFNIPEHDKDISKRILGIHCDARYSFSDIERIAELLTNA